MKSLNALKHAVALWIAAWAVYPAAAGAADREREALARLAREIQALMPLAESAAAASDAEAAIRFQHEWLQRDLDRVTAGILEYLYEVRQKPRRVPELKGSYIDVDAGELGQ